MNDQVTLITKNSTGNSFSRAETTEENTVWCVAESVTQREFFEATARGLKAEHKLIVWSQDYHGELQAVFGGKMFQIYRTYRKYDRTELYLASEG